MGDFLQVCPKRLCISTVGKRTDLFARDPFKVPITDFFGSVRNVELTSEAMNLTDFPDIISDEKIDTKTKEDNVQNDIIYEYPDPLPILKQLETEKQ